MHREGAERSQGVLVGREKELVSLDACLVASESIRSPHQIAQHKVQTSFAPELDMPRRPQCVMLMGEVGIGKTRLMEEAARVATRRGWVVTLSHALAPANRRAPYQIWSEVLQRFTDPALGLRQEIAQHSLGYQPLYTLLPELLDPLPLEPRTTSYEFMWEPQHLWDATCALLRALCQRRALLIVLDDLQWVDEGSCALLLYLVRQMRGLPAMFLCACRESEISPGHHLHPLLFDVQRERAVEYMRLPRLSDKNIMELIAPLHLPVATARYVCERAAGNPFFAEELARAMTSEGPSLTQGPGDPRQLPDTIQAVLALRLSCVTEKCQRILEYGAVLGQSFQLGAILRMARLEGRVDEDEIFDLLDEAVQAGVLNEVDKSGTDLTYHFWHPLLHTYLYERFSHARRASLQCKVAQAEGARFVC